MHITINKSQFRDEFRKAGRQDQFSYEGLGLLFDYFEECDPDTELDVIAICCEYSELTVDEICDGYDISTSDDIELFFQNSTAYIGKTSQDTHIFAQF